MTQPPAPQTAEPAPAIWRKARKSYRCANRHASLVGNAPGCLLMIEPGTRYLEGDPDPYYAGGFGHDRICAGCAAREARGQ